MPNDVRIQVSAKTKDAEKGFDKLNRNMKEMRTEAGRGDIAMRSLGGSFVGLATKIAGVLGLVTSLVGAFKAIIRGMDETKRVSGFTDAVLAGFGKEFRAQLEAIEGQFGTLRSEFGFASHEAEEAFTIMTRESRSAQVGIEELSAAMGLARITGMDLGGSARVIGQAMLGNINPVRRFVGEVSSLDSLFERLAVAGREATSPLDPLRGGVNEFFGGVGELLNKLFEGDFSGALKQLRENVQSWLGSHALRWPIEFAKGLLDKLGDLFQDAVDWMKLHPLTWPLDLIFLPFRTLFDLLRDLWEKGTDWIKQHFFDWPVVLSLGQFGVISALQEIWLKAVNWLRDNPLRWALNLIPNIMWGGGAGQGGGGMTPPSHIGPKPDSPEAQSFWDQLLEFIKEIGKNEREIGPEGPARRIDPPITRKVTPAPGSEADMIAGFSSSTSQDLQDALREGSRSTRTTGSSPSTSSSGGFSSSDLGKLDFSSREAFDRSVASLQTGMGQFRRVPGGPNEARPAIVHGGEVVGRPVGMGGITINIYGNVDNEQTARALARQVKDLLQEDIRRGIGF